MGLLLFLTIGFTFGLVLYMLYRAHHDIYDVIKIQDDRFPSALSGYGIFFISDIHRRLIKLSTLKQVDSTRVDCIIIGGDVMEKGVSIHKVQENIRRLKQLQAPIYFVWGNNDNEAAPDKFEKLVIDEGVTILKNAAKTVEKNGESIHFIGLDCKKYGKPNFSEAMKSIVDGYWILITHDPNGFFSLSKREKSRVDTVLAGHTHGGQIRFFGIGPYQRGGLNKYGQTNVFISEGYGYTGVPFRLGTKAECHLLQFKSMK
ncbi:metallophosphoesterase [Virgibacillus sp. LDC-1]|uniref:metallophosphoesterase n=1 Tax=Virgibacillus sp. LDC-1 TaxID=3039856 RepID=UPI0024DE1724|nr:metallophosphoesterase [Virgibacillus sp. LDC-1]